MAIPTSAGQEPPGPPPGTLGELLYADSGKLRVPESEWVTLVRAIGGGDQGALRALYERTHRLVFTLMLRMAGNRETAEELTIDVFHGVWQRAASYDPDGGPVIAWIMNQARSRALDRLRFEQRKKRTPSDAAPLPEPVSPPQESLESQHRASRLRDALRVLSPEERAAIEMAFFSELTYAETAGRLGAPLGTVKTRIRAGLRKLRRALSVAGEWA